MKNNKFSILSILISLLCFIIIIWVNYKISERYIEADGKTKAFFGLIEFSQFFYQYYFISLSLLALIFAFIGRKKKEEKILHVIALIVGLFSLGFIFGRAWTFMI